MARKLVVVHDNVRLAELGNIYGPISTPTRVPLESIRAMCVKNRDVWECDPADPRNREKRVKLTLANYGETNFGIGEKKKGVDPIHTPVTEKKEAAKPVAPQTKAATPAAEKKAEAAAKATEPEKPAAAPVEEKKEEAPATEVTPAETTAPEKAVEEKKEATKPQTAQNHGGKNDKK